MTDVLVTGVHGQLGRSVEKAARRRGMTVAGHDLDTLDICDPEAVLALTKKTRPAVLINCAAFTAVDDCEAREDEAMAVNGAAVGNLATACATWDTRLIHLSTDYVFDGNGQRPYREDDAVAPASAYGRSKLEGERRASLAPNHLIVRTAWLYGHGGHNFVEAIRGQIESGANSLRVVADQIGSPTFCDDLAEALLGLSATAASGIVHATNSGHVSWHGLAIEIARRLGSDAKVQPVTTAEFPRPAPRPAYSVLDNTLLNRLLDRRMPSWEDALARYLESS